MIKLFKKPLKKLKKFIQNNRHTLLFIIISFTLTPCFAEQYPITLEKIRPNVQDVASLQRGAKAFTTYCLSCHSLQYLAHDPIAEAAGILPNKMPEKNKRWWFGASPPDLSLIAAIHSADWLYTYLHAFYQDTSRPIGSNNLLVDNVNMPDPFLGVQGQQQLLVNKLELFAPTHFFIRKPRYFTVLLLTSKGYMTSDEFDRMTADLVNFLVYSSDPKKIFRERMRIWILLFIAALSVVVWLLNKEYWKDIKK